MSHPYLVLLMAVFVVHLLVFGRLALRTRAGYHLSLVVVFACLIVAVALRLWPLDLRLGSIPVWHLFRYTAWGFTLLAAVQFWGHRRRRKRGP